MRTRREFLKQAAGATAGLALTRGLASAGPRLQRAGGPLRRREVSVGGRRIKVVDVHGHCLIPEVADVIKPEGGRLAAFGRRRRSHKHGRAAPRSRGG